MKNRKAIIMGAVAGLGLAGLGLQQEAQAVPSVNLALKLQALDGTDLVPNLSGNYEMIPGTQFRVILQGEVINPNLTDTHRTGTNRDSKPLGMSTVTARIYSSAPNGVVQPAGDADSETPGNQWGDYGDDGNGNFTAFQNYSDYTANGYPFVNLTDFSGTGANSPTDNDLDVNGGGFAVLNTTLASSNTAMPADYQIGIGGLQDLFGGAYTYNGGATDLGIFVESLQVWDEANRTTSTNHSLSSSAPDSFATFGVTITAIPEPASLGLLGMAGLGLVRRRRQV